MPSHVESAAQDQDKRFARAFALIDEGIARSAFPGAAMAVTCRGQLVAAKGLGRFTYERNAPQVRAETVFDLASVTKVVATTAVAMLLYERGVLGLDEPVAQALPEFVELAPGHEQAMRQTVTISMLLAHSSGLPAYEKLFLTARTRDDVLRSALSTRLVATPGTRAEYSDVGFIILGELLAKKTGATLDAFAREQIFTQLEMPLTRFNPPADDKSHIPPTEDDREFRHRVIQGEVNDENAYVMGGVAGHAGVFARATDIAKFAGCLLRGGAPIFRAETVKLFATRQSSPPGTSRALGWDTPSRPDSSSGKHFSDAAFGHLGFTGTSLWIDPERQLSVTLLTNRTWPNRASQLIREFRPRIHDAILEAL